MSFKNNKHSLFNILNAPRTFSFYRTFIQVPIQKNKKYKNTIQYNSPRSNSYNYSINSGKKLYWTKTGQPKFNPSPFRTAICRQAWRVYIYCNGRVKVLKFNGKHHQVHLNCAEIPSLGFFQKKEHFPL